MASFFQGAGTAGVLLPPRRSAPKRGEGGAGPPSGGGEGEGGRGDDGAEGSGSGASDDGIGILALVLALAGITTLFVVLIAVWLLLRRQAADWPLPGPASSVRTLWLSTACLVASSVAVELAARRQRRGRRETLRWLVASLVLALGFLGAQVRLWSTLWSAGLVPSSSGYAAVLFALTGLHALHVLGGIGYLASLALALRRRTAEHAVKRTSVRLGAFYWHYMGGLWLVLFALLTFLR